STSTGGTASTSYASPTTPAATAATSERPRSRATSARSRSRRIELARSTTGWSCPGLELTYDDPDPARGAHVVAVGLEEFVSLDGELEDVLRGARAAGAAMI